MKTNLMMIGGLCMMMAGSALATGAAVSDVLVRQRWPWSKKVDISFVLGASDAYQDVTFTAYNGQTLLGEIPSEAISGETEGLDKAGGAFSVVFDPEKSGFTPGVLSNFRVEVAAADTTYVLYKIINLVTSNVTDVTIGDIKSGKYGTWQQDPVEGVSSVIWTGVTNVNVWATTNLVLRHIKAGSFYMGYNATSNSAVPAESQHVTLTSDFYIGVFEVTQKQWKLVRPDWVGYSYYTNVLYSATRPADKMTYWEIRGLEATANWPRMTGITSGTFCANLGIIAGGASFDLPTEAQWEYAGRAGTQTELNIGVNLTEAALATVARHGKVQGDRNGDLSVGTTIVGSFRPNAWGLYDIHGNVAEWCRDGYGMTVPASVNVPVTIDPTGPIAPADSANHDVLDRLYCGGAWGSAGYAISSSTCREYCGAAWAGPNLGFRIMMQP